MSRSVLCFQFNVKNYDKGYEQLMEAVERVAGDRKALSVIDFETASFSIGAIKACIEVSEVARVIDVMAVDNMCPDVELVVRYRMAGLPGHG